MNLNKEQLIRTHLVLKTDNMNGYYSDEDDMSYTNRLFSSLEFLKGRLRFNTELKNEDNTFKMNEHVPSNGLVQKAKRKSRSSSTKEGHAKTSLKVE